MSTETAPSFRSASRGDLRPVFYITAAHMALDFYMVLTPPLWAFFQSHYNLTVAQFAYLPTVIVFCGSITQPFMGYFSDGRDRMALVALGLFVTGIFVSCIGFAPTAYTLAIFLIFASFGSSLFHPTAGGLVTALTPHRANLSMAIFLTGGTTGMALTSITGTQIVERYGIQYLWLIVIPVLILAPFILWQSRKVPVRERRVTAGKIDFSILKKARSLWTLFAISVLRSIIHTGFVSFTAILGASRGWATSEIGWVFSGYLLSSTLGRITGGYLADRMSQRKLLAFSCASSAIFHAGFCLTDGYVSLISFFVAGYLFDLGITTNISLAQRALPHNTSTATGLVMGFSWGMAGLAMIGVGSLAEWTSTATALVVVSLVLIPATLLVALLPSEYGEVRSKKK
ncbi:MAG: MFS transporter [Gemmatimonadetes bacterium]|nr:MFS transporter [Gemmatimonadota bacterium]